MDKLKYYKQIFEASLQSEHFLSVPAKLYEPIQYSLALGGKRLRPILCLLGCDLYQGNCSIAIPAAIAIEVFHNFTLVHDDIMDNSPIRRGEPTVFKKWNTNVAILSGDVMFAKAYEYVSKIAISDIRPVLNVFTDTAIKVCEGQQYDMDYEEIQDLTIQDYVKMIELKTAVLLGSSLKIGALIAHANEEQAKLIYDFGLNMGMVFQLKDDLLDVFSDESVFGKKIGTDIISGKKTFLFLKTLELLSHGEREEFYVYYTSKHADSSEKIKYVSNVYEELDIAKHTVLLMKQYHDTSLELLNLSKGNSEIIEILSNFATSLLIREV